MPQRPVGAYMGICSNIDISDYFDKKVEALNIYDTELGQLPFPRSIEALKAQAVIRGTEAGVLYAEAFRVVKEIE